ncbi:hypothetical protein JKP88DRAFT_245498 [Tribonema minus]|uniref:Uncharacterized protein n=1 Tax=Tribonema minus TaxID=303371 RepID=A0A835YXE6_9STRA|nr:hypothetical protein JKP88DRAFT_245498 [Tribonema minus]
MPPKRVRSAEKGSGESPTTKRSRSSAGRSTPVPGSTNARRVTSRSPSAGPAANTRSRTPSPLRSAAGLEQHEQPPQPETVSEALAAAAKSRSVGAAVGPSQIPPPKAGVSKDVAPSSGLNKRKADNSGGGSSLAAAVRAAAVEHTAAAASADGAPRKKRQQPQQQATGNGAMTCRPQPERALSLSGGTALVSGGPGNGHLRELPSAGQALSARALTPAPAPAAVLSKPAAAALAAKQARAPAGGEQLTQKVLQGGGGRGLPPPHPPPGAAKKERRQAPRLGGEKEKGKRRTAKKGQRWRRTGATLDVVVVYVEGIAVALLWSLCLLAAAALVARLGIKISDVRKRHPRFIKQSSFENISDVRERLQMAQDAVRGGGAWAQRELDTLRSAVDSAQHGGASHQRRRRVEAAQQVVATEALPDVDMALRAHALASEQLHAESLQAAAAAAKHAAADAVSAHLSAGPLTDEEMDIPRNLATPTLLSTAIEAQLDALKPPPLHPAWPDVASIRAGGRVLQEGGLTTLSYGDTAKLSWAARVSTCIPVQYSWNMFTSTVLHVLQVPGYLRGRPPEAALSEEFDRACRYPRVLAYIVPEKPLCLHPFRTPHDRRGMRHVKCPSAAKRTPRCRRHSVHRPPCLLSLSRASCRATSHIVGLQQLLPWHSHGQGLTKILSCCAGGCRVHTPHRRSHAHSATVVDSISTATAELQRALQRAQDLCFESSNNSPAIQ